MASTPVADIDTQVARIIGPAMGVHLPLKADKPWYWGAAWLVVYGIAWLLLARYAIPVGASQPKLVSLLAWGGLYFAGVSLLVQVASDRIYETLREDILPHTDQPFRDAVAATLRERFGAISLFVAPLVLAAAALAGALFVVGAETRTSVADLARRDVAELSLWGVTYFIYFLTAATTVTAARFHAAFAEHLGMECERFYVFGAADTPLVRGLSRLGTQVLGFWVMVFLLIASSMLLAIVPPESYRLARDSLFLFLLVPIAGIFSVGFGTIVYLASEARIRATLQRFTQAKAKPLQQRCNELNAKAELTPAEAEELKRLIDWQGRILAGGRYGSPAGIGLSIALPLAMPVISLAVRLLGGG